MDLELKSLADVIMKPAPWDHYPHCPSCHSRVTSEGERGDDYVYCPYCSARLRMKVDWRKAPISVFPVSSDHDDVHTLHVVRSNEDRCVLCSSLATLWI